MPYSLKDVLEALKVVEPIPAPAIPVQQEPLQNALDVPKNEQVPIHVTIQPFASQEAAELATWVEKNMVIRNNLHLEGIEVQASYDSLCLRIVQKVKPRKQGEFVNGEVNGEGFIDLSTTRTICCRPGCSCHSVASDKNRVMEIVRDAMQKHFLHEIDECIQFEGKLPFDPHVL